MPDHALVTAPLWAVALIVLGSVVAALVFTGIARLLLRRRAKLRTSTSILLALFGIVIGLLIVQLVNPDLRLGSPFAIIATLSMALLLIAGYGIIAAHLQRPTQASILQLLQSGESGDVEYKSTARVNLHTGQKDPRMEHVIAKTVAAFLNSDGGSLLIGVDDAGTPLGLDADLATLRTPDLDRYELWLRDLLTTSLGPTAAVRVTVDFDDVETESGSGTVCRLDMSASPQPVYLSPGKSAPPELWVRSGNSTRRLVVDEGADYIMYRWPLGIGSNLAAQFRAAVRFSEDR